MEKLIKEIMKQAHRKSIWKDSMFDTNISLVVESGRPALKKDSSLVITYDSGYCLATIDNGEVLTDRYTIDPAVAADYLI